MGILLDENTRVLVQGITGKQGGFHTKLMLEYGTRILAGVTPGKGGAKVEGMPVYDSVDEAKRRHPVNASIVFVPASSAANAVHEALSSEIKLVVIVSENVPIQDSIRIMDHAKEVGAVVVGPNSPGVMAPHSCKLGIMPSNVFMQGGIGVVSRSGTLTYEVAAGLTKKAIGQSTCLGIGGDPIVGINFIEALELFREDSHTDAVVIIGEIGGNLEEITTEHITNTCYPKPVVAYIAGRSAPAEKRMGHAGAIIMGSAGSALSKVGAFVKAGIRVAERPSDVARLVSLAVKR